MRRIRRDPAGFICNWLGDDLWKTQIAIAESVRDNRRTAVKSCHGSGKSFLSARIVLWHLHAHTDAIAVTTAPTYNQVRNILWRSLNNAVQRAKRSLLGRALVDRYEIGPEWYALGFKAEDTQSDRFQGFHSEHPLVVIDEAAGVAPTVYDALDAVMTSEDARMLLIGNPTNPEGEFHDAFHKNRGMYHTITISADDTPNFTSGRTVRPYLITPAWVEDAIGKHGEDSPYVQARVYARFPTVGDKNLIPLAWVEAAHARTLDAEPTEPLEAGLDVARYGDDENALCIRRGPQVVAEHAWSGLDTMETVGKVRDLLTKHPALAVLKIDVIGIGAGVHDRLRELSRAKQVPFEVQAVNVANASSKPERWPNLRHELWCGLRERFREGRVAGPLSDLTMGQLSSVKYSYDSTHSDRIVEGKEQMRRRGLRSPDRAEALLLAFAPARHTRPGRASSTEDEDTHLGAVGGRNF